MAASMVVSFRKFLFSENSRIYTPVIYVQERFAKRKGKRAEQQKKQKVMKLQRLEEMSKSKKLQGPGFMRIDKSNLDKNLLIKQRDVSNWLKKPPVDDVFFNMFFKKQALEIEKAIQYHRETHHPTMYNKPNALLHATIELNLKTARKTKFVERFSTTVCYPHLFPFIEDKKIIALCKNTDDQQKALDAGAVLAGGLNIIKSFQSGDLNISDFDHLVAHQDIITELTAIRGLLKKQFPSKSAGNFGTDIFHLVNKFKNGIDFVLGKNPIDETSGWIDVVVGTLDMEDNQLKENTVELLQLVDRYRPTKFQEPFIKDVVLYSPPSMEKFYVQFWKLLGKYNENQHIRSYTIIGPDHYHIKIPTEETKPELSDA